MSLSIIIAYHTGYGHTQKVAEAVAEGAQINGNQVKLLRVDQLDEAGWQSMDKADAIIFGSPTYMGGVSAPFKAFMDSGSKRWKHQLWKDKVAAGFTNAGSPSGDNLSTLLQLALLAMQHSMIWVGTGLMPANGRGGNGPLPTDINRLGSFLGLATQSDNDKPEITPPEGDLETARRFGKRVAEITTQFRS